MNDHEPDDELVRAALEARAPSAPDPREALDRLRPRYVRARRRHRVVVAGSTIAASVVVLGGGAALFSLVDDGTERIETIPPAVSGEIGSTTTSESTTTTSVVASTLPEPTTTTTTTEAPPASAGSVPEPEAATTSEPAPAPPSSTSPATAPTSTVPEATAPASTTEPGPTPSAAPPGPVVETRSNDGGSVTVELAGGTLRLVSAAPNPGYASDVREAAGTRVEVRFEPESGSGSAERIRVEVDGGQLVWDLD